MKPAKREPGPVIRGLSFDEPPELKCRWCEEFWPLTPEFWERNNYAQCRSCRREQQRLYQMLRRRDPEFNARETQRVGRYRAWLKEVAPQYLAAYDRERKARKRQWIRDHRVQVAA